MRKLKIDITDNKIEITNAISSVNECRWDFTITKQWDKHSGYYIRIDSRCYDYIRFPFKYWLYTEGLNATTEENIMKALLKVVTDYEKEKNIDRNKIFDVDKIKEQFKNWDGRI